MTVKLPKSMVHVLGRPFLEWKLEQLRRRGITDVVLCVGYLGRVIEQHFGDGKRFGLGISYSWDGDRLLGPIGALKQVQAQLREFFFVTYGDAYLELDYSHAMKRLISSGKMAMMAVYRNYNRYGRSDVVVRNGMVTNFNKKVQTSETRWINYGVSAFRKQALDLVTVGRETSEEEYYRALIARSQLIAYEVRRRFFEIGSREGLAELERFLRGAQQG